MGDFSNVCCHKPSKKYFFSVNIILLIRNKIFRFKGKIYTKTSLNLLYSVSNARAYSNRKFI